MKIVWLLLCATVMGFNLWCIFHVSDWETKVSHILTILFWGVASVAIILGLEIAGIMKITLGATLVFALGAISGVLVVARKFASEFEEIQREFDFYKSLNEFAKARSDLIDAMTREGLLREE